VIDQYSSQKDLEKNKGGSHAKREFLSDLYTKDWASTAEMLGSIWFTLLIPWACRKILTDTDIGMVKCTAEIPLHVYILSHYLTYLDA